MITSLRLNGVKVFIEAAPIPLKPLTLLTGINSAGKSTIFQSLLLLKQAFEHPARGLAGMPLNGPRIAVGDYLDFSSNRSGKPIEMSLSYQLPRQAILDRLDALPSRGWSAETWWSTWLREAFGHVTWHGGLSLSFDYDPSRPGNARLTRAEWASELRRQLHVTHYRSKLIIEPLEVDGTDTEPRASERTERPTTSEGVLQIESSALGTLEPAPTSEPTADRTIELTALVDGLLPTGVIISAARTARHDLLEELIREAMDAILGSRVQGDGKDPATEAAWGEIRRHLSRIDDFAGTLVNALSDSIRDKDQTLQLARRITETMVDAADDSIVGALPWSSLMAERLTEPAAFDDIMRLIRFAIPCLSGVRRERMKERLLRMAPANESATVPLGEPGRRRVEAYDKWLEREQRERGISLSGAVTEIPVEVQIGRLLVDSLFHLAALRDEPRNLYATAEPSNAADIGTRGERTIACIERFGGQQTLCPSPFGAGPAGYRTLVDAVAFWGRRLGVIDTLTVESKSKHGLECHIRTPGAMSEVIADPNNVGVGVSQVLPVLWLCLAAPVGSTILIEQPELHLHPAVQNRLAEFFAACVFTGRQIIVETHSEHLVHRLRLLVAEGHLDPNHELALLYVEPSGYGAEVSTIEIAPSGELPHWPKGFFDETELTLTALMRARFAPREAKK